MEIKRRLNKVSKRLTPQIEVMNVANEMKTLTSRLEELVTYAEQKIERTEERRRNKMKTIGQQVDEQRKAEAKVISDHQVEEAEANLRDQQEAFDERNRDPGMVDNPNADIALDSPTLTEHRKDTATVLANDFPDDSRN